MGKFKLTHYQKDRQADDEHAEQRNGPDIVDRAEERLVYQRIG
jgi:hypothetical protein